MHRLYYTAALPLRTAALVARETCYTEPLNELEDTLGGTLDACRMCVGYTEIVLPRDHEDV